MEESPGKRMTGFGSYLGIWKVPVSGGTAELIVKPDPGKHESAHVWPQLLPGRGGLLYTVDPDSIASMDDGVIALHSEGKESRVVLKGGTAGRVLPRVTWFTSIGRPCWRRSSIQPVAHRPATGRR